MCVSWRGKAAHRVWREARVRSIVDVIVRTIDDLFIFKCCITNIMSSVFDAFGHSAIVIDV